MPPRQTIESSRPAIGHDVQPLDTRDANGPRSRRDRPAQILIPRHRMLPRQVLPRQFYLVTRRCAQRQFLLRPDAATNNAFLYCLIVAALRSEIDVLLPWGFPRPTLVSWPQHATTCRECSYVPPEPDANEVNVTTKLTWYRSS